MTPQPYSPPERFRLRLDRAAEYIKLHNLPPGWVVFYCGSAVGWTREIAGNSSAWVPGCVAVKAGCPEFMATGGDRECGAIYWREMERVP